MSSVNFALRDFCSLIPNVPALAGNFLAELHCGSLFKRQRGASRSLQREMSAPDKSREHDERNHDAASFTLQTICRDTS
jgi:hypothetical protein